MSEPELRPASAGLAGLLSALQPREPVAAAAEDLELVRETAWNEGVAAGSSSAMEDLAPLRSSLVQAADALRDASRINIDGLAPVLAEIVRSVAQAVLMVELSAGAKVLIPLVEAALRSVRPDEAAVLHVHPDTLAMLAEHLPEIATVADDSMPPDGFAVTGNNFVIEAGLQSRLLEIMGEIT